MASKARQGCSLKVLCFRGLSDLPDEWMYDCLYACAHVWKCSYHRDVFDELCTEFLCDRNRRTSRMSECVQLVSILYIR